jgi:hypothetical protein
VDPLVELLAFSPASSPAADALDEEFAVDPAPSFALELALPDALAPAPLALALALELELAPSAPALPEEWLSADALADAASAVAALKAPFLTSVVRGVANMASARALAETISPSLKLLW